MDVWILRYPEPRKSASAPRQVHLLEKTSGGAERGLEIVEIEIPGSPLQNLVTDQVARGRTRLILDLAHEKHMDSNDLAQTLEAFKQAAAGGGELVIANPNSKIREIFRITHLDQVVALFDSVDEAVAHFGG